MYTIEELEAWISADLPAVKPAVDSVLDDLHTIALRTGYHGQIFDNDPGIRVMRSIGQKLHEGGNNATEPLLALNEVWRGALLKALLRKRKSTL